MKAIFNNPLSWAKSIVGNKWVFGFLIGAHIFIWAYAAYVGLIMPTLGAKVFLLPFFIFGVSLPLSYLYALRKLVIVLKEKHESENS
jgi:hypothetical protein